MRRLLPALILALAAAGCSTTSGEGLIPATNEAGKVVHFKCKGSNPCIPYGDPVSGPPPATPAKETPIPAGCDMLINGQCAKFK